MVMDRTPLTGAPTQHKAFKIIAFVNQVAGIAVFRELDITLYLFSFWFESGDESAQVGKFHFPRFVL